LEFELPGFAVGLAGALGVSRYLASLLCGVHAADPLTFTTVAVLLFVVAVAACYIPARPFDPRVALRYE
jgi:hypothetical protein